jgi:hypothetical protein
MPFLEPPLGFLVLLLLSAAVLASPIGRDRLNSDREAISHEFSALQLWVKLPHFSLDR